MDSNGNDSAAAGEIATAEITDHNASTRAHMRHIQKLAAAAVEAIQEVKLAVRMLDEHLAEPTAEQNATFVAWFEAELNGGGANDRQREADLLEFWRKLHPGTSPARYEPPF